ncbi:hypothetical protein K501DRAFT_292985 [Backusella circina FSU 941]|nr:hypothetical protein K501DRAFT_292985 [Backusella circina FSU 941]
MANERTYLAWVRTSLSTISIGVALTQIFRFDKTILQHPEAAEELQAVGTPLGIAFILIGMFYLICACIRYFHSQDALTKGYFPASRGIVILASASTFIALVSLFFVISKNH